jgi:hypothetical protein
MMRLIREQDMLKMGKKARVTLVLPTLCLIFALAMLNLNVARAQGRVIDLYTQKAGKGEDVSGGVFNLTEIVELTANLTYNGYPVQHQLVAFSVLGPGGFGAVAQAEFTNASGYATMQFSIPALAESFGTWNVSANAQLADEYLSDFLTFDVVPLLPRPPKAYFTETLHELFVHEEILFDASLSEPGFDGDNTCPIVEYRWDFGDGTQVATALPTIYHAYSSAGVYYVTLTVYAPGIPSFIDPQYVDLNITYPPQRKLVHLVPVGGFSQPGSNSSMLLLVAPFIAPAEILTITFVMLGMKRTRKKLHRLINHNRRDSRVLAKGKPI